MGGCAAEAQVRPDDRRVRVALEQRLQIRQVGGPLRGLGEGHVQIVVEQHDQAHLGGEVQDAIQRRVQQAGRATGGLRGDELLVDAECFGK